VFFRDLIYWINFHRISGIIQYSCPSETAAGVYAVRMILMALILASGEYIVAGLSTVMPLTFEGIWRATLCFAVALGGFFFTRKSRFY
jgi:hypothetical protein